MSKLADGDLLSLLPASISDDPQMRAAAEALAPVLKSLSLSLPNLLVFSRLGGQPEEGMLPPLARLTRARGGLKPLSLEELEQLAWQFHVDFREVATTREQLAAMVRESIPWHRIKGTPAGVRNALSLFGYQADIEENGPGRWWATYQLGLPEIADLNMVRAIVAICNEMAPARCRLWRIYTDVYDWRPGVWSGGAPENAWGNCWWSWYSGVEVPDIPGLGNSGLMVSFGRADRCQAESYTPLNAGLGIESAMGVIIPYVDRPIWGHSDWGDIYPVNSGFTVGELLSVHWCEQIVISGGWDGLWDDRPWVETQTWDRILPAWTFAALSWARTQAVYAWADLGPSGRYGDINACYSLPVHVIFGQPPRWGGFAYSEDDPARQEIPILERYQEIQASVSQQALPSDSLALVGPAADATLAGPVRNPDHAVWGDAWGDSYEQYHVQRFWAGSGYCAQAGDRMLRPQDWSGAWDAKSWTETAGWVRTAQGRPMTASAHALSQAVYAWADFGPSGRYGDINACYSPPVASIFGQPPRWGESLYSEDAPARVDFVVTGRSCAYLGLVAAALEPGSPQAAIRNNSRSRT